MFAQRASGLNKNSQGEHGQVSGCCGPSLQPFVLLRLSRGSTFNSRQGKLRAICRSVGLKISHWRLDNTKNFLIFVRCNNSMVIMFLKRIFYQLELHREIFRGEMS